MIHLVYGKVMIDCDACYTRVEITRPVGTVKCPRCNSELTYNTRMTMYEFGQMKRKARELHTGVPHKGGPPRKWIFTPEMDERIVSLYDSRRATIETLAKEFGFPEYTIRSRARQLGVTRFKPHDWTADEINFLKQNYHLLSWPSLRKHLGRSETAIRLKARRLGIRQSDHGFTMRSLCDALGVDHHKVGYWLSQGWLTGKRRCTKHVKLDYWFFDPEDIRSFIVRHPWEVDLRRVEPLTFIEILTGAEIDDSPGAMKANGMSRRVS